MRLREQLILRAAAGTMQNHSRKQESGLFDPNERGFLSGGTLLDLAEDPLMDAQRRIGHPFRKQRLEALLAYGPFVDGLDHPAVMMRQGAGPRPDINGPPAPFAPLPCWP